MKRKGLWVFALLLSLLIVAVSWLSLTSSGLQWAYRIASAYLPAEVSIQQLDGVLSGPLRIGKIQYQVDGNSYQAEQLTLQWKPLALLSGVIAIQSLNIKGVTVMMAPATSSQDKPGDDAITLPEIKFPIRFQVQHLRVESLAVMQDDSAYQFRQLQLSASTLFDQLDIRKASLQAKDYQLELSGRVRLSGQYRHQLKLHWQYQLAQNKQLGGQGELVGDLGATQLTQHISGAMTLDVRAQLEDLLQDLSWKSEIQVSQFDSQQLVANWPELRAQGRLSAAGNLQAATVQGSLSGSATQLGAFDASFDVSAARDGPVKLARLMLTPKNSNSQVQAQGEWTPGAQGGVVDAQLEWQHLKWPLSGDSWFDSESGRGHVSGTLEDYAFSVQTTRPWVQIPESDWQISGKGNLDGLVLNDILINTLEGEISANARVNWKQDINWDAQISLQQINPARAWPQWPGKLSAKLVNSGSYADDNLAINGEIVSLSGELRDYPVSLKGKLAWSQGQLDLHDIRLQSGASRVAVSGRYADQMDLQYVIDSQNLAELYPAVSGVLKAEGRVSGSPEEPLVTSNFQGRQLAWQDYRVGSAKGQARVDLTHWFQASINLDAQQLLLAGMQLQSAQLTTSQQGLDAHLVSDLAAVDISLQGELQQGRWQGAISRADIQSERLQNWRLQSPSALSVSADDLQIDNLCWINMQKATACASITRNGDQYQARANLQQLALSVFKPWITPDVSAQGLLNATADLTLDVRQHVSGQVSVDLPQGSMHYTLADGEKQSWHYRDGRMNLLLNEQGIRASSSLLVNQNDSIQLSLQMPKAQLLSLGKEQAISAEARVNIRDIHLIESLIPEVQEARGEVLVKLNANGTLNNPGLKGQLSLEGGSFKVPRLGLNISQLSLTGVSQDLDQMELKLKAHSGEGDITVSGNARLHALSDWSAQLKLSGENFQVSRIPEASVRVSPDLNISIKRKLIDITGNVHVPYARLNPKDVSSAVQVSEDVVIIGEEQTKQQKWTITSRVRVTLDAEHVHFYGYGFEGDIGGSILLEDVPGQLTRATGEIRVPEGRYRAYGQRLAIENGRLVYSGGPVTNPGLDFKARRVVNEVTAGVSVSGTLLKPRLELYSIPAMGQTDALAYLILGRPLESSSNQDGEMIAKAALALGLSGGDRIARMMQDKFGLDEMRVESSDGGDQASLVVGRYLSPRLYVSYGVGLIESINTFSIRYQLSSKWQLKAESGASQSADLFYTIER